MTVGLSYARVLSARKVNDRTLLDIAVQTDAGEVRPGEIEAGGFVTANSLILGAMIGDEFVPMRSGGGRRATIIRAMVDSVESITYGRYRYAWTEVEPGTAPGEYTPVSGGRNSIDDGPLYNGMEAPNASGGSLGSGIDSNNLPAGFTPTALGHGAVVWIEGPFGTESDPWWDMSVSTHVDGECGGGGA